LPQQSVNENQGVGSLFSTSNPMGLVILVILMIVIIIMRFLRTGSKKKKMAKSNPNKNNSNYIDLLVNVKRDDEFHKKKDSQEKT
jgi:biopolymer transport protein ExbD